MAVLKDEELLATYMLQNIAGSLAARLCPLAVTAGCPPQETVRDQRKRPRPVLKLFSTCLIHKYNSSTLVTRVHVQEVQYRKPVRAARGGGECNGGKITLYSNFTRK